MVKKQTAPPTIAIKCSCSACGATLCLLLLDAHMSNKPELLCVACYVGRYPHTEEELTVWLTNHKRFRGG
jgi:hypothetical protein